MEKYVENNSDKFNINTNDSNDWFIEPPIPDNFRSQIVIITNNSPKNNN